PSKIKKASNKYFCFDNEKLNMITGGKWELEIYPHLPFKYKPKDVNFIFYIIFNENTLQANIITVDNSTFMFIHNKTTEIKNFDNEVVYTLKPDGNPIHFRNLLSSNSRIESKIKSLFSKNMVFYQSNEIGEVVRNYIQYSIQNN